MERISQSEIDFIRKSLSAGVRPDGRDFSQSRAQTIVINDISQADNSITIKRGNSEIIINLSFKSSLSTLCTLKLIEETSLNLFGNDSFRIAMNSDEFNDFVTLKSSFNEPNPCFRKIENWLKSYSLGCLIELIVIKSDGNIFNMFFEGLRVIFQSLSVPDIRNLSKEIQSSLILPSSMTFGILNEFYFLDPSWIEERAASGIMHVFDVYGVKCIVIEGQVEFDLVEKIVSAM